MYTLSEIQKRVEPKSCHKLDLSVNEFEIVGKCINMIDIWSKSKRLQRSPLPIKTPEWSRLHAVVCNNPAVLIRV